MMRPFPLYLETLLYEKRNSIALVTVNRPRVMNALNAKTFDELRSVIEDVRDDGALRGLIVTGAGDHAFVAGADIGELAETAPTQAEARSREGQALFTSIEQLGKPSVAAVNGAALGGGCELALACTIRIASTAAQFGQPEIKLGLVPGFGGTQRLARLVGLGKALELILTGDPISAEDALGAGLVNAVVPPNELLSRAIELLERIAANAPLAVGYAIEAVNLGLDGTLAEGLAIESKAFGLCAATQDMREGTAAFLEKRAPRFAGR